MSKTVKVVIGALVISVVLCLGIAVAGILYSKNLIESSKSFMKDGEAFGATNTDRGCFERTLEMDKQCRMEAQCIIQHAMFLGACVGSAKHDPSLCEGIPAPSNDLLAPRAAAQAMCTSYPTANTKRCTEYAGILVTQCAKHHK